MLEIGIQNKYSVNLWLEYFPKAFIYGIDINFLQFNSISELHLTK